MADIHVETLTDDCWRYCDDFDVEINRFYKNGSNYFQVFNCRYLNLCSYAASEKNKTEEDDEDQST